MNRICVGIVGLTPGWTSLLDQIGIWYEELKPEQNLEVGYSAIILNTPPDNRLTKKLNVFLSSGGAILSTKNAKSARFFYEKHPEIHPVLPIEFESLVSFSRIGSGLVADLSFNPDEHLANNHYSRQRFYFKPDMHPDELVSSVNKEALTDALIIVLKHLHFFRELPYIQKWHSPEKNPVFAFRVDSDWGDQKSVQALYELGKRNEIPMTWFLHVQAHEDWLNTFHDFKNHEIALHGYEHGTSTSYEHVINNIERGKQLLLDAGFDPTGFCVPYGIWNDTLADVLTEFDFKYSSEFTIGYNCLPFYPIHEEETHPTLQIPIHPICTGSLNRKSASVNDMEQYFLEALTQRTDEYRSTIFYHHPLQPGLEIWDAVFDKVNEFGLTTLTFSEFAEFWTKRQIATFEPVFDTETKQLHCSSSNNNLYVQLCFNQNTFHLIKTTQTNEPLHRFEEFEMFPASKFSDEQLSELTAQPLSLMKTSLLDWKNRKKL